MDWCLAVGRTGTAGCLRKGVSCCKLPTERLLQTVPYPQFRSLLKELDSARDRQQRREDFVVATKVTGPSGQMTWIRDGPAVLDRKAIASAVDGSLARLRTDYIDLYQLHWPDRCACVCDGLLIMVSKPICSPSQDDLGESADVATCTSCLCVHQRPCTSS